MPKLLYTWYFEKFTASVTSSGHSALRHEVSRICTILLLCKKKSPIFRVYMFEYTNVLYINQLHVAVLNISVNSEG